MSVMGIRPTLTLVSASTPVPAAAPDAQAHAGITDEAVRILDRAELDVQHAIQWGDSSASNAAALNAGRSAANAATLLRSHGTQLEPIARRLDQTAKDIDTAFGAISIAGDSYRAGVLMSAKATFALTTDMLSMVADEPADPHAVAAAAGTVLQRADAELKRAQSWSGTPAAGNEAAKAGRDLVDAATALGAAGAQFDSIALRLGKIGSDLSKAFTDGPMAIDDDSVYGASLIASGRTNAQIAAEMLAAMS